MASTTFQLCPVCKGHGTRVLHGAAFTAEDIDQAGPGFLDDMATGVYDTKCDACQGMRVVDDARMTEWRTELADQRQADAENGMYA